MITKEKTINLIYILVLVVVMVIAGKYVYNNIPSDWLIDGKEEKGKMLYLVLTEIFCSTVITTIWYLIK